MNQLPVDVQPYRTIGPFSDDTVPKGLLKTHNLAAGVWGRIRLESGSMAFVWEDGSGRIDELAAPAELVVPPLALHHLERLASVRFTITFHKAG